MFATAIPVSELTMSSVKTNCTLGTSGTGITKVRKCSRTPPDLSLLAGIPSATNEVVAKASAEQAAKGHITSKASRQQLPPPELSYPALSTRYVGSQVINKYQR